MIKIASVKFAIPKGSLEEATFKLLENSWTKVNRKTRTYRVYLDDSEIKVKMLRPQEIPNLVSDGLYDCLLYTSPSPRDGLLSRMPSSA